MVNGTSQQCACSRIWSTTCSTSERRVGQRTLGWWRRNTPLQYCPEPRDHLCLSSSWQNNRPSTPTFRWAKCNYLKRFTARKHLYFKTFHNQPHYDVTNHSYDEIIAYFDSEFPNPIYIYYNGSNHYQSIVRGNITESRVASSRKTKDSSVEPPKKRTVPSTSTDKAKSTTRKTCDNGKTFDKLFDQFPNYMPTKGKTANQVPIKIDGNCQFR